MAREDLQGQVGVGGYSDFEFTVTDAWFGPSEAFEAAKTTGGPPTIFLHWVGDVEGIDGVPNLGEDGFHPSYEVGADWEVINEGKSIKYVGSGKERFGKWYGRVVGEIFDFTQDVPQGQHPFDGDNHPKDAQHWIGTKWFMEDKEYDFGRLGTTRKLVPTRFLGSGQAASTPAAAATPAGDVDGGLMNTLETLAKASDTYADFQKAALAVPGVAGDTQLVSKVVDQTDNGLYATARS